MVYPLKSDPQSNLHVVNRWTVECKLLIQLGTSFVMYSRTSTNDNLSTRAALADSRYNDSCLNLSTTATSLRACLHGGGGPPIGEVTCGGSPHLSCKRDQIKMRHYMDRRVTPPPKRVTSPTWGPPPQCKQALKRSLAFVPKVTMVSKPLYHALQIK